MNTLSYLRKAAFAALLTLASLAAVPVDGQPNNAPAVGATITPNYKDADLGQIIQAVSEVTGKNFIVDPRVNAKVTMLSSTPMSAGAFYEAFLSVLQVYGYVAVPAGKVIKIVPNTDSRQMPSRDLPDQINSSSDELVTQIITLKNINATALVPLLRPLVPQYGQLAAYGAGNMLIISDRSSNVSRLMRIIERMDESGDEPYEVIPLKNASATDLVRTITQLNQGAGAPGAEGGVGGGVKVVADQRTNSILISGEKSLRLRIKALILDLDTPRQGAGETEVRYLRYADAEKLAEKLKGQASASSKAQAGPQGSSTGVSSASSGVSGSGSSNVDASVTIWADVPTNALILTAPPKIMTSLMAVIDKLDIRRAQVQVEALIVEVDVNKSSDIGVQWIVAGNGTTVPAAVTNLPNPSGASIVDLVALAAGGGAAATTLGATSVGSSAAAGLSSSTLGIGASLAIGRYNANSGTNFAALVQAIRSDGTSNVISTPSLITMNNEEAQVKVTQEIPLITGSYSSSTAAVNGTTSPFTTIQREEVGTILKVTPHISEGNAVQLKIEQEDSSPGAKLANSADISTNKRAIKTTVLIEDGGIIVLGGLMSDTVSESEDRVPGLGAIPIIGNLFKSRSGSRQKKNLLVFIRPKILRDDVQTESTSEASYNEMRNEQGSLSKGHIMLLPGEKQPLVPEMHTPPSLVRPSAPNVAPAFPTLPDAAPGGRDTPPVSQPPPSSEPAPTVPPVTPPSEPAPTVPPVTPPSEPQPTTPP
jgi:general secretion pathway protein D